MNEKFLSLFRKYKEDKDISLLYSYYYNCYDYADRDTLEYILTNANGDALLLSLYYCYSFWININDINLAYSMNEQAFAYIKKINNFQDLDLYYAIVFNYCIYKNLLGEFRENINDLHKIIDIAISKNKKEYVLLFKSFFSLIYFEFGENSNAFSTLTDIKIDEVNIPNFFKLFFIDVEMICFKQTMNTEKYLFNINEMSKIDFFDRNKSFINFMKLNYNITTRDIDHAKIYVEKLKNINLSYMFITNILPLTFARYYKLIGDYENAYLNYKNVYNRLRFYLGQRKQILSELINVCIKINRIDEVGKYFNDYENFIEKCNFAKPYLYLHGFSNQNNVLYCNNISDKVNYFHILMRGIVNSNNLFDLAKEFSYACKQIAPFSRFKILFRKNSSVFEIVNNKTIYLKRVSKLFKLKTKRFYKIPEDLFDDSYNFAYIAVLKVENVIVGYILFDKEIFKRFDDYTKRLSVDAISMIANSISTYFKIEEIDRRMTIDPLTNAYNRYGLKKFVNNYNFTKPVFFVELDIDNFKPINDFYGHPAGDLVLKELVSVCQSKFKKDRVFRIGGEEFVIIFDGPKNVLISKFLSIESEIKNNKINYNDQKISFSISYGGVSFNNSSNYNKAYQEADKILYRMKNSGKGKGYIE